MSLARFNADFRGKRRGRQSISWKNKMYIAATHCGTAFWINKKHD